MKELIKKSFDLWVQKLWLKTIDKEADKYNKIEAKRRRQAHIVNALYEAYKKKYPDHTEIRSAKKHESKP